MKAKASYIAQWWSIGRYMRSMFEKPGLVSGAKNNGGREGGCAGGKEGHQHLGVNTIRFRRL